MNDRSFLLGIRAQLIGFTSLVVLAVVAFQVLYFPAQQSDAVTAALEVKARAVSELVSQNVATAVFMGMTEDVEDDLDMAMRDSDVAFMAVYDERDQLIAGDSTRDRPPSWASDTRVADRGDVLLVQSPIRGADGVVGHLVTGYKTDAIRAQNRENLTTTLGVGVVILVIATFAAWLFGTWVGARLGRITDLSSQIARGRLDLPPLSETMEDEVGITAANLDSMLDTLRTIERHVGEAAKGNLTQDIRVEGDLADAMNRMFANQRELVMQIASTASEIANVATEILTASKDQESGANEQASVVEETLRTMETLLNSANRISETSGQVQEDAEQTHSNNRMINERITQLAGHTDRIGEFLEVIRDIANKTELLALNAALEGTRAGEAGRGFSLVATQMQRLTESVMEAVRDIKQLTADIREATTASVLATEEGTKRASNTAQSARQISLIIQQQRSGTEQVTVSMDEISRVIRNSVAASTQGAEAAAQLNELADQLQGLVKRFEFREGGR